MNLAGKSHAPVTVTDTASVDLAITAAQALSATVLAAGVDHGGLAGLTDDDHAQYPLLLGRAADQTLIGSTAANGWLRCKATSHGTKTTAGVSLCEDGGAVAIGQTSAETTSAALSPVLDIKARNTASNALILRDSSNGVKGSWYVDSVSNQIGTGSLSDHPIRFFSNGGVAGLSEYKGNVALAFANGGHAAPGTSAVGNLLLWKGTRPTTSPADLTAILSDDSFAGHNNVFTRNEQGKVQQLTGLVTRVTTQFDKTLDAALANVTGLSLTLEAGKSFGFRAVLFTTSSNVAGGVKVALNSGLITLGTLRYEVLILDNIVFAAQGRGVALGTAVGSATVANALVLIEGSITTNAGGGLNVQFAQQTANAVASSVLVNSFIQAWSHGD